MTSKELREKILELAEGEKSVTVLSALNAATDIILLTIFKDEKDLVDVAEELHQVRLKTIDQFKALKDAENKELKKS